MLLTVSTELPLLVIVMLAVAVCPVVTFPNAKVPAHPDDLRRHRYSRPRSADRVPALVLSEFTVTVPLYVVNVTERTSPSTPGSRPPQSFRSTPAESGRISDVRHRQRQLPLLIIVSVAVRCLSSRQVAKRQVPLSPMIFLFPYPRR